jgi:hypothetical protein
VELFENGAQMKILFATLLMICAWAYFDAPEPNNSSVFNLKGNTEFVVDADTKSLLRNPCMGWMLYDDACGEVADADKYWALQDTYANKYASIFYVRWRWAEMEPEEGKYAWIHNENYKKLIQGALDRGLKLAFRIYDAGKDNIYPGTPEFVKTAGAKGIVIDHWTPYEDDPVFKQKLENFVRAFAVEYDNPSIVDFVDGVNTGYWGECHHLVLEDESQANKDKVLDWITTLYADNFRKVPLVMAVNSEFGHSSELRIAQGKNGYAFRRDGLGSMWFNPDEKKNVAPLYPSTLLIGETCYWGGDQTDNLWFDDATYHFKTWKDIYETTFKDAIDYHFNTLDLRTPVETERWLNRVPELVQKFIEIGGYRLYPDVVSLPKKMQTGKTCTVAHRWINLGTGVLPNNNKNWNYKYKIAFALLDANGLVKKIYIDSSAEPSDIILNNPQNYQFQISLNDVQPDKYTFAIAIIDVSNNNKPGIKLATQNDVIQGWTKISSVEIK